MPQGMAALQGISLNQDYLLRLAAHNAALLQHGIFNAQGEPEL
ncbi:hypothetical protein [Enterovibrio nigricans]|nr:hypothetical protein [Enterovibrio nigricans]